MVELCELYKKGLQGAYLHALDSTSKALENEVEQYPIIFDENLKQVFTLFVDCEMVDSCPISRLHYSTPLTEVWKTHLRNGKRIQEETF